MNWQNQQETAEAWEKRLPIISEGFEAMCRVSRRLPDETIRLFIRDGDMHVVASHVFLDAPTAEMLTRHPDTTRTVPGVYDLPEDA